MLRFEKSRAGDRTARYNNSFLHSRYAPRKEAERFVATVRKSRCYVILGAGLGYIADALIARYPESRVCSFHASPELADAATWSPGVHAAAAGPSDVSPLIDRAFGAEAVYGFELLVWEPGRSAAPHWSEVLERALLAYARRSHDSLLSTGYFGYSWLSNAVSNLNARRNAGPAPLRPPAGYPVLFAPGPTAEKATPWIKAHRHEIALIAVSSAKQFLEAEGVEADLVIHTDGGYWATFHLHRHGGVPIAAALKARLPRAARSSVALLLPDPTSPVEVALTNFSPYPFLPIPGHGTVTGTALRVIQRLFAAPPLLIGLDLAAYGYRGHARPHAFDPLHLSWTNRLHTQETALRSRLREPTLLEPPWMAPRDLTSYATVLEEELAGRGALRMHPSPLPLPTAEVSGSWNPPPAPAADLAPVRFLEPAGGPVELLRDWRRQLNVLKPERLVHPLRDRDAADEAAPLEEELCRLLALPELLRLRRAWDSQENVLAPFEELRDRVGQRIDRLITRASS